MLIYNLEKKIILLDMGKKEKYKTSHRGGGGGEG
jgi:hypothetical protein